MKTNEMQEEDPAPGAGSPSTPITATATSVRGSQKPIGPENVSEPLRFPFLSSILIGPGRVAPTEADPNGKSAHEPGSKLDAGKVRPALVLGGFARALLEVSKVGTYGATKYTENGWVEVPNGEARYDDAKMRHWLREKAGQELDPESDLVHAAHEAWGALARLELMLRKKEQQ